MTNGRVGLWARWVLANAAGGAFGPGLVAVIGLRVATAPVSPLARAVAWLALGTIAGLVVGAAQARVIGPALGVRGRRWVVATALGVLAACAIGMVPGTAAHLSMAAPSATPARIDDRLVLLLVVGLGLGAGVVLALPQALVLRRRAGHVGLWLVANGAAWAVGLPLALALARRAPLGPGPGFAVLAIAYLALAGAVVGAVHGLALVRLRGEAVARAA